MDMSDLKKVDWADKAEKAWPFVVFGTLLLYKVVIWFDNLVKEYEREETLQNR